MIDSLYLDLGDRVRIRDSLLVLSQDIAASHHSFPVLDNPLWYEEGRGVIRGRRAYFRRTPLFPFDICLKVWRDGKPHLLVKFSVPELLYGDNVKLPVSADFRKALDVLKDKLERIGVSADPGAARVVRVDLCRQVSMISEFASYAAIFRVLSIPGCETAEYASTFLWRHRSGGWAINVYDKTRQNHAAMEPEGLLRVELQLRNRKVIERVLGTSDVERMVAEPAILSRSYGEFLDSKLLLEHWHRWMQERNKAEVPSMDIIQDARRKGGTRWRSAALREIGIATLCRDIGMDHAVSQLLDDETDSSTRRSRRSRLINEMRSVAIRDSLTRFSSTSAKRKLQEQIFAQLSGIIQ